MKNYNVYLYPDNQPEIFLGEYSANNKDMAISMAFTENYSLKQKDKKFIGAVLSKTNKPKKYTFPHRKSYEK